MKTRIVVVLSCLAISANALAAGQHFSVSYPPSSEEGELSLEANYYLWVPDCAILRGIIVHQHGCGEGAEKGGVTASHDLHWQALAKKWSCALMGSSYRAQGGNCRLWCDPRNGSDETFLRAISDFARTTKHPELQQVPWCLWGHSGGGFWASLMQVKHPERIVAIWLRSGTAYGRWESGEIPKPEIPEAAYRVPVMCNPGAKERDHERFHVAWDSLTAMFKAYRAQGAPIGFAPDPRTSHECGDSRYLAIPFFDACLAMRLTKLGASDLRLKPVDMKQAWLAPLLGTEAQPAPAFEGETKSAVWLPNKAVAKAWAEYVKNGATEDATPPPAPVKLTAKRAQNGDIVLSWEAEADFESGLQGFTILRDGRPFARLPEKPVSRFGRALFQAMSYHDTPSEPLPEMKLSVSGADAKLGGRFQVVAVNSAGLQSAPSKAVTLTEE